MRVSFPQLGSCLLLGLSLASAGAHAVPLTIQLRDAATGQPAAARLLVRDSGGWLFEEQDPLLFTRLDPSMGPYVHAEDELVVDVLPGTVEIWAVRGLTGIPVELLLDIQAASTISIDLERWIDPLSVGWVGADPHLHPWHAGNPYPEPPLEHIGRMGRAEDLDVLFLLANDAANPSGRVLPPEPGAEMEWGEEYRNAYWGHMIFLELPELIATDVGYGCCGDLNGAWPPLQWTLSRYAPPLAIVAHPVPGTDPKFTSGWPGSGFARELYALAVTGGVHGMSVAGGNENGRDGWVLEEYLDVLRGGARWAAIGEGDRGLNRHSLPPPGIVRTYAHVGSNFPADPSLMAAAWREGVRQRRSFATTGPILRYFVADLTWMGGEISLPGPGTVQVAFYLESLVPMRRVTIHGATRVHWEGNFPGGETRIVGSVPIALSHDDFLLLEAEGVGGSWTTNPRGVRLVSSPIWVDMNDPWEVGSDLSRRAADTLREFWERSLGYRGYDSAEDSVQTRELVFAAAGIWEAMFDEDPGAFDLLWPEDGRSFSNTRANLAWERSRSYDGEATWYEIELDDLADSDAPFVAATTSETSVSIDGLLPGHEYSWTVHAYEPGEGPTQSLSSRRFRIAGSVVGSERSLELRLSSPALRSGSARAHLELPRAGAVQIRWVDLRGRVVRSETDRLPAGENWLEWNLRDGTGASVANGVYWLVVDAAGQSRSRKLTLLR